MDPMGIHVWSGKMLRNINNLRKTPRLHATTPQLWTFFQPAAWRLFKDGVDPTQLSRSLFWVVTGDPKNTGVDNLCVCHFKKKTWLITVVS